VYVAPQERLDGEVLQETAHSPTISPQSARELAELLVRLNVTKARV
jgi:hypothetical protein